MSISQRTLKTTYYYEILHHQLLWRVAEREAASADQSKEGSYYHNSVAMVVASLTVEGYANWIGPKLAPGAWSEERNYFIAKSGYPEIRGKLQKIPSYSTCRGSLTTSQLGQYSI